MKLASLVLLTVGAILVLAGIGQVFWQMARGGRTEERQGQAVKVTAKGFEARSAYPGVWMVGMGVVLLVTAAWTSN